MARRKKNSAKVNLIISAVIHAAVIAVLFVWAAREGILGKKLKEIAVVIVPKEKPPEPPKPPPPPRIEPPKEEPTKLAPPKIVEAPKVMANAAPPPTAAPAVAP